MTLPPTCKTCRWFNWKVTAAHSWGECLNPVVQDAQWVFYTPPGFAVDILSGNIAASTEEFKRLVKDVREYARIYYREDEFGCRFHGAEEASHDRPA